MSPATAIETTGRKMYELLARMKRQAKHRTLTNDFETALEAHVGALRVEIGKNTGKGTSSDSELAVALSRSVTERYEIQDRLMVVDAHYAAVEIQNSILKNANIAAGEEMRATQQKNRELMQALAEQKIVIENYRKAYAELHAKHARSTSK